ncbi:MAG TPA: hypothetical protein DD473_01070 [Planctomycetaceae bacterium]|nr:hypothetical protein [Planctomycetaceae bacterium]
MQGRSRILVIEDDPMFRSLVVSFLRKDYLVAVAADGKTGLDKAIIHRPDLVVIDFQMPGWDGITTLQEFRRLPNFSSTKFVMLTSDASKKTVVSAIHAGTDDYIIKTTFNKDLFTAKIHKLLAPVVAKPVILSSYQEEPQNLKYAEISSLPKNTVSDSHTISKSVAVTSRPSRATKTDTADHNIALTSNSNAKPQAPNVEEMEIELIMDEWD